MDFDEDDSSFQGDLFHPSDRLRIEAIRRRADAISEVPQGDVRFLLRALQALETVIRDYDPVVGLEDGLPVRVDC